MKQGKNVIRHEYSAVSPGNKSPEIVRAVIEIPKGCRNKFEVDPETGLIKLDRYLYSSSHYPGDYGFIPQTLAEDGDALDILVMVNEPTFSGCLIEARILGVFCMADRGVHDFKILGVPETDPLFAELNDISDLPQHYLKEVQHFFETYKQLEEITVQSIGWKDRCYAIQTVKDAIQQARKASD